MMDIKKKQTRQNTKVLNLLIIEDDKGEVALIEEYLHKQPNVRFKIEQAYSLSEVSAKLAKGGTDIVILDLMLPDSKGLDTFTAVSTLIPDVPIVILSGMDDDTYAIQSVALGAQDYLVKGAFDGHLLLRFLLYAIERNKLQLELAKRRQEKNNTDEIQSLDRLSGAPRASITSQMLGKTSLRNENSEIFDNFTTIYSEILDVAVQQRIYKADNNVQELLHSLAEKLGFLKSGPRDIVEIHSEALKMKIQGMNMGKVQLYMEESRLTLLELMGNLVSYYRNYFIMYRKTT
ncbi:MAG: response regulator [Nitrospirae bacterium]|nr:response regulator [Nitrospirota bacterium]